MVEIKTPAEIALMREAGRVVAHALAAARDLAEPGRTTADLDLIADTEAALARGIAAARPENRVGDIGHAIAVEARAAGYGLTDDHCGHGIGRTMHEAPDVPNDGRPGRGFKLRPGLVIAIEPQLVRGGSDGYAHGEDGWTVLSDDGTRAAHCEHTVAVTEDGPVVLTLP